MANLSDLDLVNEHGNTKSEYTLLKNHATALARMNKKVFITTETPDESVVDGGIYFAVPVADAIDFELPPVEESENMEVFIQNANGEAPINVTAQVGEAIVLPGAPVQEENTLVLQTQRDFLHLICDGNKWYAIAYLITP